MSNERASEPAPARAPATQGTSPVRVILFAILGLMILAGAYDFLWARKGPETAANRLDQLAADPATAVGQAVIQAEPITYEKAIEVIGRPAAEYSEGATYFLEKYCWRSGLPWRTHDLYVVYTKSEPRLLHTISIGQAPTPDQLPQSTAEVNAQNPAAQQAAAEAERAAAEAAAAQEAAAKDEPTAEEKPPADPPAAE